MLKKKECIAMLLAGGQGSRLFALTSQIAKPAVAFGAKYRILDFPLSNCANAGVDTVGILTQYQPLVLNEYVGNGQPWDLDRTFGGVHILSPYEAKQATSWYKGTANAIYQNIRFMKEYDPEYILILSGDHIYKMDYDKMLDAHKKSGAACTIAAMPVSLEDAKRFGILNCNPDGSIYQFEEKPAVPKSNLASMGIYVFTAQKLFDYLEADNEDPNSQNDFGKNVVPAMLAAGEKMMSYLFEGYWKDVGTIQSLWEANMDLLGDDPKFNLASGGTIHSRSPLAPPAYITGELKNSLLATGCEIEGDVFDSVIGTNCIIEEGAEVHDSVLMGNITVKAGAKIWYSIIDENVTVCENATVGKPIEEAKATPGKTAGIAVLGRGITVSQGASVPAGTIMEQDV
ncbi:MAG: glucose-1-phosphate adenylyltransferase [Clostridia bacterium]|nr:glucose-1-phosphate adenylyltransferase [Clostridia bacterium]